MTSNNPLDRIDLTYAETAFERWRQAQKHLPAVAEQYKAAYMAGFDTGVALAIEHNDEDETDE